ncbi:MAG: hypothetical protein WBA17_13820 [Saprospiraceae bacterium]
MKKLRRMLTIRGSGGFHILMMQIYAEKPFPQRNDTKKFVGTPFSKKKSTLARQINADFD